jgi:hypothetical protein
MASPRRRPALLTPPSVPKAAPSRPTSRQLALPLPPLAPFGAGLPPLVPNVGTVQPQRVWARLPPRAQVQIRQTVRQVLEEVVRNERCAAHS